MTSLILRTATRPLLPLMLLFALFLFLRGHNDPGGGFIAGLVASAGFALYALAHDAASARRLLHAHPRSLMAAGLAVGAAAGLLGLVKGRPYMAGLWTELQISGLEPIKAGTPLLFDLGVFLVVVGVTLTIVFSLMEE